MRLKYDDTLKKAMIKPCKCGQLCTFSHTIERGTVLTAKNTCFLCGLTTTHHCSENTLQRVCVSWFRREFPECFIHANKMTVYGDGKQALIAANHMIADGSMRYFLDLIMIFDGFVVFTEMKKGGFKLQQKNSTMLTNDDGKARINGQYLMAEALNKKGHPAIFCNDFETFKDFVFEVIARDEIDWLKFSKLRGPVRLWEPRRAKRKTRTKMSQENEAACKLFEVGE